MGAAIAAIAYALPETVLSNEDLAAQIAGFAPSRSAQLTGVLARHVVGPGECASDLGRQAAQRLFAEGHCRPDDIDFLLLCTQCPDYWLPTTACLLHRDLGLRQDAGALDFNLGCSGYVYGLGLAKGLIQSGQARNVLLITAETYSRFLAADDRSTRTIFGDAAAATVITAADDDCLGPFVYGTDGRGADNLIVRDGAGRNWADGNGKAPTLYMNGPEIFNFTLDTVPAAVHAVLERAGLDRDAIDLFVFHQANRTMLDALRDNLGIPADKFWIDVAMTGNTVSSTVPIALSQAQQRGVLKPGQRVMLVGFGVGYSWGATVLTWAPAHPPAPAGQP